MRVLVFWKHLFIKSLLQFWAEFQMPKDVVASKQTHGDTARYKRSGQVWVADVRGIYSQDSVLVRSTCGATVLSGSLVRRQRRG